MNIVVLRAVGNCAVDIHPLLSDLGEWVSAVAQFALSDTGLTS